MQIFTLGLCEYLDPPGLAGNLQGGLKTGLCPTGGIPGRVGLTGFITGQFETGGLTGLTGFITGFITGKDETGGLTGFISGLV